ncbi:PhoH family protein [Psychrobium sp. MM17-31]|uniref:PhoH family protein n=1 Tax=Psychrobium sp. MM17-31 TaxID=2917758 RepID=UPI001EF57C44|nr:PhoH family protein [Psychrobium sp. MM17-31]MCG7529823.1 PhoH family protein [Psychrobium sp. MM17-31]
MAKNIITVDTYMEPATQARLIALCGPFNDNLKQIERRMGVEILYKDNLFQVIGRPDIAKPVSDMLRDLYLETAPVNGQAPELTPDQVHMAIEECRALEQDQVSHGKEVYIKTRKGIIKPRNPNQQDYVANILANDITFGVGPAGTGKTYLAVACAVDALERQEVRRILLTRPAVEAGEKLGFLPGDLSQKVDPYLRPLYDALFEMLGFEKVEKLIEKSVIEIAPLAYMRGRTLNDAFIILDESQNTTTEQMKMFLTRIGFNSKAIITGDITQVDLPRHVKSGLRQAIEVLGDVDSVSFNFFQSRDIVRHQVVARVVDAYQAFEDNENRIKALRKQEALAKSDAEKEESDSND